MKKLLTIQDISCYGQCSITVALPIISAVGVETVILPSMILSTHTSGFKGFTALSLYEEQLKIVKHWKEIGLKVDSVYSGYLGNKEQIDLVKNIRHELSLDVPLYVDPAMADNGKLYPLFNQEYVEQMKSLICEADVIVPNMTEACLLIGKEYQEKYTEDDVRSVLKALAAMGPKQVVLTGIKLEDGFIGAYSYDKETDDYFYYASHLVGRSFHGTGDVFASVFFGKLTKGFTLNEAVESAVDFTYLAIKESFDDADEHWYGVHFEKVLYTLNDDDLGTTN